MIDYNKLLGNYNTTFFSVHLFDNDISTYAHEYIHHIQNITTPYGLTYYASRLIYLLHEFIVDSDSYLYNSVHKLWKKNRKMIEKTIKQVGASVNLEYDNSNIEDIVFIINKKHFSRYGIKIVDAAKIRVNIDGEIYDVPFTVRMIKENMARLIQNRCFPQSHVSKNVTYYLIEEIIERYSPNFPVNAQTVVALCDIALIADSPIHAFFNFLDYCKQFDSAKINARFMYECIKNEKITCLVDSFNITELLDRQLDVCFKAIDAFYISFDSQAHIRDWIKKICYEGIEFRKKKFSFLCDVMDDSISIFESQIVFFDIVKNLGFTIEMDYDGQIRIPKGIAIADFVQLIALEEYTMKITEEKNGKISPCTLKKFCEIFVRNDTISVGYGTRSLKVITLDELRGDDIDTISTSVINETCNCPLKRDIYNNLCPFTYVRRNIEQNNQKYLGGM